MSTSVSFPLHKFVSTVLLLPVVRNLQVCGITAVITSVPDFITMDHLVAGKIGGLAYWFFFVRTKVGRHFSCWFIIMWDYRRRICEMLSDLEIWLKYWAFTCRYETYCVNGWVDFVNSQCISIIFMEPWAVTLVLNFESRLYIPCTCRECSYYF